MHVKLKVLRGASAGKEIPVTVSKFFIGRSEECQLRANSDAISRRHCVITVSDHEVSIRDLGSRNGTHVNGVRIEGDQRLQMGDQLRVGPLEFLVTHLAVAKAPSAPVPRSKAGGKADDEMAGLIDDWLSEGEDDPDHRTRVVEIETRAFRIDDTNRIDVPGSKEVVPQPEVAAEGDEAAAEDAAEADSKTKPHAGLMSQRPGSSRNVPPKDTQEAAAQTLRKFFNRGGN